MKSIVPLIALSLLTACGAGGGSEEGGDQQGPSTGGGSGIVTHNVCRFNDSGEGLVAGGGINEAELGVLIESMSQAASDIDLDTLTTDEEKFVGAFATVAFVAPSLADTFASLSSIYACTEAAYQLNQCSWDDDFQQDGSLKVETVIGAGQSYTTSVYQSEGAEDSLQQSLQIEGVIGDLGNTVVVFYDDGAISSTRTATRNASGDETVRWASAATNWFAEETSNCTGSLTYEDISDSETVSVDAEWSLSGEATTGSLDYAMTGETPSSITLNW